MYFALDLMIENGNNAPEIINKTDWVFL